MYGIPNMKLDKTEVVDRRVNLLREEGIEFRTNADVSGTNTGSLTLRDLANDNDAVLLATGATVPNDLPCPGKATERNPLCHGIPYSQHEESA